MVLLLALIGIHAVKVAGGYRAYRKELLARLEMWRAPMPVVTLYGHTGAGKSALLRALSEIAPGLRGLRPWPLDLEALALHRGSLLGGLNQPGQRRQKDFDALLWEELRRPRGDYLVLEGEGGKIGRLYLPATIAEAVRTGLAVSVTAPAEARAERIMHEYAPAGWDVEDITHFRRSLQMIGARLPRSTYLSLETAFDDGRFTDVVRELLVAYYDPMYQRSSIEGRRFVYELPTSLDPLKDARRFIRGISPVIREVLS